MYIGLGKALASEVAIDVIMDEMENYSLRIEEMSEHEMNYRICDI